MGFEDAEDFGEIEEVSPEFSSESKTKEFETDRLNRDELLSDSKNFFLSQKKNIGIIAKKGEKVVHIDFTELSEFSPKLAEAAILKPEETF